MTPLFGFQRNTSQLNQPALQWWHPGKVAWLSSARRKSSTFNKGNSVTAQLPKETVFFRCLAAISLPRPTRNVNPHLYFEGLERGRVFRLHPNFRSDVQPTFNPEGKAEPSDPPHVMYVWQLKADRPYDLAFKNWPGQQVVPWYYFESLIKAETDLYVPILPFSGESTFMSFNSSPQVALAGGAVQTALPVLSTVRLFHDRTGHRPIWIINTADMAGHEMCSVDHRFLSF